MYVMYYTVVYHFTEPDYKVILYFIALYYTIIVQYDSEIPFRLYYTIIVQYDSEIPY